MNLVFLQSIAQLLKPSNFLSDNNHTQVYDDKVTLRTTPSHGLVARETKDVIRGWNFQPYP